MKFTKLKSGLLSSAVSGALLVTLIACNGSKSSVNDSDEPEETSGKISSAGTSGSGTTVDADRPSDSTGVASQVTLGFSKIALTTDALGLQETNSLDGGGGIIVTDARVSIGTIKIKANKEMDQSEEAHKAFLKTEKKNLELKLESEKKALELEKEAIKSKFEPMFEAAANDTEKELLKIQMENEKAAVEEKMAALEASKDAEMDNADAQKDGNLKWKGPFVYNLVDNTVTPPIPEAQLVDGSYKRIEFKIKPNRTVTGSDPLLNNAVYIAGNAAIGGSSVPFTVSIRIEEEFKLMGAGSLKVDPGMANNLTVAFNPSVWFTGVDMSGASVNSDGIVVISAESNQEVWQMIRDNLKRSTRFGEDEDGDGTLKESESEGDGDEAAEKEIEEESETAGE